MATLRIPITNVHGGALYTMQIRIGSRQVVANVQFDTGSSSLAVVPHVYDAALDAHKTPTPLFQYITYGDNSGWLGPVVHTSVTLASHGRDVTLFRAPLAITEIQTKSAFPGVDGIIGLAYRSQNPAFDLRHGLGLKRIKPAVTFPWPFPKRGLSPGMAAIRKVLNEREAQTTLEPYFSELEERGLVLDRFALYMRRAAVRKATTEPKAIARDPRNRGWFIAGGGESQRDLYRGGFSDVLVLHDVYYNVELIGIQVEGCAPYRAKRLQYEYRERDGDSNCIVDSGTQQLVLSNDVYRALVAQLASINPRFPALMRTGRRRIASSKLNLREWPNINFYLVGKSGEPVKLTCTPRTYWQDHTPLPHHSQCFIAPANAPDNASVLGLPLLNNYYAVFDRSRGAGKGIIRFAALK